MRGEGLGKWLGHGEGLGKKFEGSVCTAGLVNCYWTVAFLVLGLQ